MSSSVAGLTRVSRSAVGATLRRPLLTVVALWALSRMMYYTLAFYVMRHHHRSFHQVIVEWDAALYDRIARQGFESLTDYVWPPSLIFIIRAFHHLGIGAAPVGLVIGALSTLAGAIALYRIAGPRTGIYAAVAWLVAPPAVFNLVLYTEPPFCAFAFWAWERMLRGKWAQMAVLAMIASSFRITGVFLIAAIGIWLLTAKSEHLPTFASRIKAALWLLLPFGFYAGCELFLYFKFHDWMAWYHAQTKGWNRKLSSPAEIAKFQWSKIAPNAMLGEPGAAWSHRFEIVSLLIGAILTVVMLVRKRWGEATYLGLQVIALGTSTELMALNRGTLVWWPLWLVIGQLLWKRRGDWLVQLCYWGGTVLVSVAWAWCYMMGFWAG